MTVSFFLRTLLTKRLTYHWRSSYKKLVPNTSDRFSDVVLLHSANTLRSKKIYHIKLLHICNFLDASAHILMCGFYTACVPVTPKKLLKT